MPSTLNDSEKDEVSHLCLMRHKKKHNELTYSDSDSYFNPSYNELQNFLIEMHGDALNVFNKIGTKKRVILTLQAKILKVKNDFETLKSEHASLVNEHIVSPPIETPKVDLPKVLTCMDLDSCESCLKLHEEIERIFQEKISRKK
jgi:hypothetical protein